MSSANASPPPLTISLLCPTWSRPENALRLAQSVLSNAKIPSRVEMLFWVDNVDPRRYEYQYQFQAVQSQYRDFLRFHLMTGDPIGVFRAWNAMAQESRGDLIVMAADDQIYRDPGWDVCLDREVQKYPDRIFCMWFNEGHYREKLCTFPIVSRRWFEALGYFTPPMFERLYGDLWIMDVGHRLGRLHYIPDILTEHLHWSYGKSAIDQTYEKQVDTSGKLKPVVWRDKALFEQTAPQREEEARKLLPLLAAPVALRAGMQI